MLVSGNIASLESWGSFASFPQQITSARFCRLLHIAPECTHVQLGARWLSMLLKEMRARFQHIIAHQPGAACMQVRPSQAWRVVLLAPEATAWLVDLLQGLPPHGGSPGGSAAVKAARRVVVVLCGVSGDIFMPPRTSGARRC